MGIQKTLASESEDKNVGVPTPSRKSSRRFESYKKSFGNLRGTGGREVFPFGADDGVADDEGEEHQLSGAIVQNYWKGPDTYGNRTMIVEKESEDLIQLNDDGGSQVNRVYSPEGNSPTVPTASGGRHIPKIVQPMINLHQWRTGEYGNGVKEDESFTLDQGSGRDYVVPIPDASEIGQYGAMHSQKPQSIDGLAHTVRQDLGRNVKKPHNPIILPGMRIRRLTPTECSRLQSFPDDWTAKGIDKDGKEVDMADTSRYKFLGNALTVNVVAFIGKRMLEAWDR